MKEIWKDIPNYEGFYQISNLGNVRSVDRIVNAGIKNNNKVVKKGKILNPVKDKDGYLKVSLSKNNIRKNYFVHRLVGKVFISNNKNLKQINHKDENKENNCVSNLEWCDNKYNQNYGTRKMRIAKSLSKPIIQYDLKGNYIKKWESATKAEENLNICRANIWKCCVGERNHAGGYKWQYIE